jgi:hypothetical protein
LSGYQPLAAELTAKDGERTFKLNKDAVRRPIRGARAAAPRRPPSAKPAPQAAPVVDVKPAPPKPADPYPRFD